MKEKKQGELSVLLGYAGKYKALTFLGMFLSAVAMVMGMLPYVCIWLAARDLIAVAPNWTEAKELAKYGWMAFGFSFGGILVYFAALIQKALKALTQGRTVIMIAHRLSTVVDADRIVVLDRGCVVEEGTHETLSRAGGLYERMWKEYNQAVTWKIASGKEGVSK